MCFDCGSQTVEDYNNNNNETNASELFSRKVIKIKWKINWTVNSRLMLWWLSDPVQRKNSAY